MTNRAFVLYGSDADGQSFSWGGDPAMAEAHVWYMALQPDGSRVTVTGISNPASVIIDFGYSDDADTIRAIASGAVRNALGDPELEIIFLNEPGSALR